MATVNELLYLWQVGFEDGTVITQPPDDRYSKHDDQAEWNPSAFRDVQEKEETSKIIWAILKSDAAKRELVVDLRTGFFSLNGVPFQAHPQNYELKKPKLIIFRETKQDLIETVRVGEDGQVIRTEDPQLGEPYVNAYYMGWEDEETGVKQLIAVG